MHVPCITLPCRSPLRVERCSTVCDHRFRIQPLHVPIGINDVIAPKVAPDTAVVAQLLGCSGDTVTTGSSCLLGARYVVPVGCRRAKHAEKPFIIAAIP